MLLLFSLINIVISSTHFPIRHLYHDNFPYEFPLKITQKHQPLITICIGNPRQCFHCKISTNLKESLIFKSNNPTQKSYNPNNSSSYVITSEKTTIKYGLQHLQGIILYDDLHLPGTDISFKHFSFIYIDNYDNSDYQGVIGLGYNHLYLYSLMHRLTMGNYINQRLFSVTYEKDNIKRGALMIGSIDLERPSNQCHMIDSDDNVDDRFYECLMTSVLYYDGNKLEKTMSYNQSKSAMWSPGSNVFGAPKDFYDMFIQKVFREHIDKNECVIEVDRKGLSKMVCEKRLIENEAFGVLIFVFGKWSVKCRIKDLFIMQNGSNNKSYLLRLLSHDDMDRWILGYDLFRDYQVVFNIEGKKIHVKYNKGMR